jgi:hypothetical protein
LPVERDGFLLYECQQGSPEWLQSRAGVITASQFKVARAKLKRKGDYGNIGDPTEAALDFAFQKAIERICRVPLDEGFVTWQMKRGQKLEPFARACHEDLLQRRAAPGTPLEDIMCQTAGFMTTPDGLFGASVDSLIGVHGGGEYKCLVSAKSLRRVILFNDISEYMDQVQGCMWISGRKWWHFGLYCPALKPIGLEFQMIEVERDDDYIEALQADLLEFNKVVDKYEETLRDLGAAAIEEAAEEVRRKLAAEVSEEAMDLLEAA